MFAVIVRSAGTLTVTCEAGGPYVRTATKIIRGEVTSAGAGVRANVTVSIAAAGLSEQTVSNQKGRYNAKFVGSLDAGTYAVSVTADNNTHTGTCSDTFQVRIKELSPVTVSKTFNITGIAVFAGTGGLIPSGTLSAAIVDESVRNDTSITNGQFTVILTGDVKPAKRYLVQLHAVDSTGAKENWSQIIVTGV